MPMIETDNLCTITEAARFRGTSNSAISHLIKKKRLPVIQIGGKPFIPREALEQFIPGKTGPIPKQSTEESRN